ncbi:unnamed protein product [Hymenolepis diminuta]|uniref:Uncharacterized protein n=1 Tax=Hymenolepis diminuta TaxID=6216 RepID=A0A0R3SK24_HYMDI|nr:unnamed protein product [Hymenolepis diminuta]
MHKKKRRHDGSSSECGDESTWSTLSTESYVDYIGVSGNESKVIMYGNDVEIKKVINDISNDSSEPVNNKDLQEQVPEDKTEISEIVSEIVSDSENETDIVEHENDNTVHEVEQPGADLVSKASFREVKKLEDKEESRPISLSNNKITVGALVNEEGSNDPNSVTFTETSSSGEYESQRFYKVQNGESRKGRKRL